MGDLFKDLVYSKEDVILFPEGIPGFEHSHKYVIASIPEYIPFEWLVSVDAPELKFAIVNPLLFRPDYSPKILKEQLEDLEINQPDDILLYTVVTIKENPLESTANLIGPIIINRSKKIGKQIIIDDERYSVREPIIGKK